VADLDLPDITDAHRTRFREALLDWYHDVKREMPWRNTDDPYRIWVSEIMLQQTRVDQAEPYYQRFTDAFPTVHDLAEAERDAVLQQWEGLGYYSRARYLHEAAQTVVREHGGTVPSTYDGLKSLKGIGPYTAAAVASIAFGKAHGVLDGNVIRVLTRVFAIEEDSTRSRTRRRLQALADALVDPDDPGNANQALMELGATVCTPRNPSCEACVLEPVCEAAEAGNPEHYPVTPESKPVPHHDIAVGLVFDAEGRLLIQRRPDDAMLGGLWEFPGGKREEGESTEAACRRELQEELGISVETDGLFYTLKHAYSHFKITLYAYPCRIVDGTPTPEIDQPMRWVTVDELDDYAFPRANRKLIEELKRREYAPSLFD